MFISLWLENLGFKKIEKIFTCVGWLMHVLWSNKELVIIWQTVTVYKTLNTKMVCLQKGKAEENK